MTDEIKTNGNASEASDQDQMGSVSRVTYNVHDVAKSQWSIKDRMDVM